MYSVIALASVFLLLESPFAASIDSRSLTASIQKNGAAPVYASGVAERRVAIRLQRRIEQRFHRRVPLNRALEAVRVRRKLFAAQTDVRFIEQTAAGVVEYGRWSASAFQYPHWIAFAIDDDGPSFFVADDAVRLSLESGEPVHLPRPQHASFHSIRQDRRILRGSSTGTTAAGFEFDAALLSMNLTKNLTSGGRVFLDVPTQHVEPKLHVTRADGTVATLNRLSVGRSDFARSPFGRIANIRTALLERMNGAVIPARSTFSFNDALVGASGWKDALVIVNGKDLVYEPGGGICQASTTVYRAMLLAGLPVTERKSHSLYVTYYKEFGVGIDATVYFGKQDLKVVNDSPGDIVMLARIEGTQAIVELFGIPDGRTVAMEGPYFAETAPGDFLVHNRPLRKTEIAWLHTVRYANGETQTSHILSQYNSLPRSLHTEFPSGRGLAELLEQSVSYGPGLLQ